MGTSEKTYNRLGIDIGSTTVKVAILDSEDNLLFSDYQRHFANIQETLAELLTKAYDKLGPMDLASSITGSGGLTLAKHLDIPFVQEVVAVATSLKDYAPQTDVAIELGGEDAKIIYYRRCRSAYERYLRRRYWFIYRPDGFSFADRCIWLK